MIRHFDRANQTSDETRIQAEKVQSHKPSHEFWAEEITKLIEEGGVVDQNCFDFLISDYNNKI